MLPQVTSDDWTHNVAYMSLKQLVRFSWEAPIAVSMWGKSGAPEADTSVEWRKEYPAASIVRERVRLIARVAMRPKETVLDPAGA